ncbi:hypothetical protein QJS83_16670 [Bdellovibrio sp. 22V]|uniref:hypothetical protein n=1 Tax=Bdellovibrio TaxID=958 RepID=UPI002542F1F5|nr:hypothetical protein [Bdellovibrio sp. 22V]WII72097.1 hypothetical protein QJS83_16670 [Bdellovibrio sp. 22V]
MKAILGAIFMTMAISLQAQADEYFVGARKFMEMMDNYKANCADECSKPFREAVLFTDGKKQHLLLSQRDLKILQKIAVEQASIWVDTILEGDYISDGNTELTEVIGIFYSNDLIGYKIHYTEKAWYIGECDFDGESDASLSGCAEGVIQETSFVSADFKTYIRNDDEIADFYN